MWIWMSFKNAEIGTQLVDTHWQAKSWNFRQNFEMWNFKVLTIDWIEKKNELICAQLSHTRRKVTKIVSICVTFAERKQKCFLSRVAHKQLVYSESLKVLLYVSECGSDLYTSQALWSWSVYLLRECLTYSLHNSGEHTPSLSFVDLLDLLTRLANK